MSSSHSDCVSELAISAGSASSGSVRSKLTMDVDTVSPGLGGRLKIGIDRGRYTVACIVSGRALALASGFRSGARTYAGSETRVELSERDTDMDTDREAE